LHNIFYLFIYVYIHTMVVISCNFKQLGKNQVKYMNVYINSLIDELLKFWEGITMYDICKPTGKKIFQCCGILLWTIHGAPELTHFGGM
jgi:hypothetical protein